MSSVITEAAPISVQAVFTSPTYSDLTLCCGHDKYLLHQAIVCPRSKFFDAAGVGIFKEVSTATIKLDGDDPHTVNRMLIYLYTNDYPEAAIPSSQQPEREIPTCGQHRPSYQASKLPHHRGPTPPNPATSTGSIPSRIATPAQSISSPSQMMNNVLVYAIADKYDLFGLKSIAKERVGVLAKRSSAYTEIADFPEVVKTVFESTPAMDYGLREIIIDLCSRNIDKIMSDGNAAMTDTIQEIGSLSFGILRKTMEADRLALDRAKSSKTIIHANPAHCKAENCRNVERMFRQEEEMTQAIAAKDTAKTQLKEAVSQKDAAIAQYRQLEGERNVANTKWNKAVAAQKLAIRQTEFAINQRNQVIVERDAALKQASDYLTQLDYYLNQAHKWKKCRNCGLDVTSWLQRVGSNFTMQLRCSDCGCRHKLGAVPH